jgi:hypothetical protein
MWPLRRRKTPYRVTVRHASGEREIVNQLHFRGEPAHALSAAMERARKALSLREDETMLVELVVEEV